MSGRGKGPYRSCCRRGFGPPPVVVGPPVRSDLVEPSQIDGPLDALPTAGAKAFTPNGSRQTRGILEIPLELLAEICAYLEPLDLRSISLTNKAFRSILMSRDSRQMWKSARTRTYEGMPECPDDMSEPQYVQLLFAPECFTCEAQATEIDIFNRVKYCSACFKENHLTKAQILRRYRGFPPALRFPPDAAVEYEKAPYYKPRMEVDYEDFLNLKSTDERVAYESTFNTRTAKALESTNIMRNWMRNETSKQAQARYRLYESRRLSIEAKMVKLNYKPKDIRYPPTEAQKFLNLLHDVTEEEWASMRPTLENIAAQNKAARLDCGSGDE